jgi:TetR/AcrR family transcriptional regulator, ethionamide resistance regulator
VAVAQLLSDHGRLLLAAAENSGHSVAQLAAAAGLSQAAVTAMLAELVDAGYLRVENTSAGVSHWLNSSARVSLTAQRLVTLGPWAAAMLGDVAAEGEKRVHPTRRDEVRDRLLIAVEALFDRGETFAGLTVERLISEAGLSRSTFYTYFADKAELLQELAADVLDRLFDAAVQWWERDQIASKAELHEGIRGIIVGFVEHRVIMRAISDAAATDATVGQQWVTMMKQSAGLVARHIRMGQAAGFIDPSLDPESTGTWLNWAAERALTMLVSPSDPDGVERWHQVMTDLYWNLLYQGAS